MTERIDAESADCKFDAGILIPVIDRNSCEGKGPCVEVCPYDVFVLSVLPKDQRTGLSFKGKVKGFAHGWKQAELVNPDACHGCGLCVTACPEDAIKLARNPSAHA